MLDTRSNVKYRSKVMGHATFSLLGRLFNLCGKTTSSANLIVIGLKKESQLPLGDSQCAQEVLTTTAQQSGEYPVGQ